MKKYFIVENNQQSGPLSKDDLRSKNVAPETLVWFEGMANWEQVSAIPDLNDLFTSAPPPLPGFQPPPPVYQSGTSQHNNKQVYQASTNTYQQKPNTGNSGGGLIAIGYLLALLGGIGGIIIGSILWMSKEKQNGEKIKKYTPTGQLHGAFAFFLGIIVWAICVEMFLKA